MLQFTYSSLKNLDERQIMLSEKVSSIGWQAGGFGVFNEQARVLTLSGAKTIKDEIKYFTTLASKGVSDLDFEKECPLLASLIK